MILASEEMTEKVELQNNPFQGVQLTVLEEDQVNDGRHESAH